MIHSIPFKIMLPDEKRSLTQYYDPPQLNNLECYLGY